MSLPEGDYKMQAPPPVPTLLSLLEAMAAKVKGALAAESLDWLWRPAPDEWSLTEVMCHLRDVELEVHQHRLSTVIESEEAFISGVSADEWAEARHYRQQDGHLARDAFLEARQHTLRMLSGLPEATWSRQGQHAFFGPTTLQELVYLAVRHDDLHWEQIKALVGEQQAAGPG